VIEAVRSREHVSIRRLARAAGEPVSTVGAWVRPATGEAKGSRRRRPVADDPVVRRAVRSLCQDPRHLTWGYRRVWALLRRQRGLCVNKKTVWRIMHEEGLVRAKVWHRPRRPRRVERMRPTRPNAAWQIDMTSVRLSDLTPLFLVTVIDCYTREIVGYTLDRRCRASEWVSAVRMGLEGRGLVTKDACGGLTLRSDNGAQPSSKRFVEFLGRVGVRGQYTGYNAPDDNAFVERVIRTVKEEEVWPNEYDTVAEAQEAIARYVRYYNEERIHSSLGYRTPREFSAAHATRAAA